MLILNVLPAAGGTVHVRALSSCCWVKVQLTFRGSSLLCLLHPSCHSSFNLRTQSPPSSVVIPPPPVLPSFPCFLNLLPCLSLHHCPLLMNCCFSPLQLFSHICCFQPFLFAAKCWNHFRVILEEINVPFSWQIHFISLFFCLRSFMIIIFWLNCEHFCSFSPLWVYFSKPCSWATDSFPFIYDIITGRKKRATLDKLGYKCCHTDAQRKRDGMTVGHDQMDGCSCSAQPCSCTLTSGFWARPGPTWRLCSLNVWFPEAGQRRGPLNPLPVSQQSF